MYCNASEGSSKLDCTITNVTCKGCRLGGIAFKRGFSGATLDTIVITESGNGITSEDFGDGGGGHPSDIQINNVRLVDIGYMFRGVNVAESAFSFNRMDNTVITDVKAVRVSGNIIALQGCINFQLDGFVGSGYPASPLAGSDGIIVTKRVDPATPAIETESDDVRMSNIALTDIDDVGIRMSETSNNIRITGNNKVHSGASGVQIDVNVTNVRLGGFEIDAGNSVDLSIATIANVTIEPNMDLINADNTPGSPTIYSNSGYRQLSNGSALPNAGSETPTHDGQELIHLLGPTWWKARSTTTADFVQIG